MSENGQIDRLRRGAERGIVRGLGQIGDQPVERVEARQRVAPEQAVERREMMPLERAHSLDRIPPFRPSVGAKRPLFLVAPVPPDIWSPFRTRIPPPPTASNFCQE